MPRLTIEERIVRHWITTAQLKGRRIMPLFYDNVKFPETPQEQIDICLACPLPECRRQGCPLEQRGLAKWEG